MTSSLLVSGITGFLYMYWPRKLRTCTEYLTGDQFCDICSVSLASREGEAIPGPGEYVVAWRRSDPLIKHMMTDSMRVYVRMISPGQYGSSARTRLSLPLLCPPQDGLVALMNIPSTAKLHAPIQMQLTVRNRNTTRSAIVTVALDPNPLDAFVVAGLRSGRLPIILPDAEETIVWNLIPIECGLIRVPRVRVVDHRKAPPAADDPSSVSTDTDGDPVPVIDIRFERWTGNEFKRVLGQNDVAIDTNMVLVLP